MIAEQYTSKFKVGLLAVLLVVLGGILANNATAQDVAIYNTPLGSGTPGSTSKLEDAKPVMDGMYHAPQYMPGYPTAATLFPRVVDVECTETDDLSTNSMKSVCNSYNWSPAMGRGEYLFIRPTKGKEPVVVEKPIVIYKEVPVKKGLQ